MSGSAFAATNRLFEEAVIGRGDWAALERVYTADARILPPGAPMIEGRAAVTEFWRQAVAAMGLTGVGLHTVELRPEGDAAWEIGRAELTLRDAPAPVEVKYVVIWRREAAGWRWQVDIWNTSA
ncbi:MAG TPA: DUF4440 domain-containing protein [Crenalkalicoccus sp.]|jgi:ketosteroid isomerase-like protein|nr:DUF4440 domain-containing protein [Crenalkalicoccus sp.]